jgi:hypothetical protein
MFLYALYMFRAFITHPQKRHCKLGRRFDNLSMLVVVSYNTWVCLFIYCELGKVTWHSGRIPVAQFTSNVLTHGAITAYDKQRFSNFKQATTTSLFTYHCECIFTSLNHTNIWKWITPLNCQRTSLSTRSQNVYLIYIWILVKIDTWNTHFTCKPK